VVIGGGAGGLVTALISAGVGARVAMIERGFFGGDCLVTGCVPSKAFIKSASVAHTVRTAEKFGIKVNGDIEVDFPAIMKRMREVRTKISANDGAKRWTDRYGIDVFLGEASFENEDSVRVNG
jgi:pyruvate/2-oxoglutarate dehydrogenase complex dihydrolipoamide dehydrogenase (E3) component